MKKTYFSALGGLPGQDHPMQDKAVFKEAYAVIPRTVMRDIVTSYFPHWERTRAWVLARPLSGFAETFSYYVVEVEEGGGSSDPEPDVEAEAVLFVVAGEALLTIDGVSHDLRAGSYAYLAKGESWTFSAGSDVTFHWIRKSYETAEGISQPTSFVTHDDESTPVEMEGAEGIWSTSRFVDPDDLRHDMHVNIVNFVPGGIIPFAETHVMEHGIYILQGTAHYYLNGDWVEVEAGDFLWLRAFCPQACVATGDEPFRYLLYKDVNRHAPLTL